MEIINRFYEELNKIGAKCSFISMEDLRKIEIETSEIIENKLKNKNVYEVYLKNYYNFSNIYNNTEIKNICVVASPSPEQIIKFEYKNSFCNVKIPPVYTDKRKIINEIREITDKIFIEAGYKTFPIVLPKKSMAVHSGLAKYGKNNLVYIEGMGSFHRLTAFAINIPYNGTEWNDSINIELCESCGLCERLCPTGAINKESFLIDADKCLTFYNEKFKAFPEWIDSSAHHSLLGCLKCQESCPQNKKYNHREEVLEVFNEEETEAIIEGKPFENLPAEFQNRLKEICLDIYYKRLSRNLKALWKI